MTDLNKFLLMPAGEASTADACKAKCDAKSDCVGFQQNTDQSGTPCYYMTQATRDLGFNTAADTLHTYLQN